MRKVHCRRSSIQKQAVLDAKEEKVWRRVGLHRLSIRAHPEAEVLAWILLVRTLMLQVYLTSPQHKVTGVGGVGGGAETCGLSE